MSDPWSDALAEAYAVASLDDVILQTLELRHPSFAEPVRLVADLGTMLKSDPEPLFGHVLTLEADAVANAGQSVRFYACGFEFTLPEQQEGSLPTVEIAIDNVAHFLTPELDALIGVRARLAVTYREYLASDPATPQYILNGLTMSNVASNLTRVTGQASFADLINRSFPGVVYRAKDFPGLVQ